MCITSGVLLHMKQWWREHFMHQRVVKHRQVLQHHNYLCIACIGMPSVAFCNCMAAQCYDKLTFLLCLMPQASVAGADMGSHMSSHMGSHMAVEGRGLCKPKPQLGGVLDHLSGIDFNQTLVSLMSPQQCNMSGKCASE